MPWTTPRTWTPGELVTADLLNTHLRDNLLHIYARLSIGARVANTLNQSIPNTLWTPLGFSTARYDTDTLFSLSDNSRLTAQTAGKYLITTHIQWAPTTARRELRLQHNDSTTIAQHTLQSGGGNVEACMSLSTVYAFNAGDYVTAQVWHNHGSTISILGNGNLSAEMTMQWLSE